MKNKKIKNKGFTLIELIVVITIIAVLTVVAVVSYGGASQKSRDGRRSADLQKVAIALELYKQEKGIYPDDRTKLSPVYLQAWPKDPKSGFNYYYLPDPNATGTYYTYELYAQMEGIGETTGNYSNNCGTAPSTTRCNYMISNP